MHHGGIEGCTRRRLLSPLKLMAAALLLAVCPGVAAAAEGPALFGVPVDFILFALTLLGVALFHHHTLRVALIGLATIAFLKPVKTIL